MALFDFLAMQLKLLTEVGKKQITENFINHAK